MRSRLAMALGCALFAVARPAAAEQFGGFANDGVRYVVGQRLCEPHTGVAARWVAADSAALATLKLDKGTTERGATARVKATAIGTKLRITTQDGAVVAEWDSGDAIASVDAVYLARDGKRVAIELGVRVGGRARTDVVVLPIAAAASKPSPAAASASAPVSAPSAPAPTAAAPTRTPAQLAAAAKASRAIEAHLAKKRWSKAEAAARAALATDDTARVRLLLAAALARQGRSADAVAELVAIARSGSSDLVDVLIDARESPHLAALRADPGFRRAVGLELDPSIPVSATLRLLGTGGRWEQPSSPCKQPEVALALDRKKLAFKLEIHLRCQGQDDTTRLRGRFEVAEPATLVLVFPNSGAADERLECKLAPCDGEDCLACALDELSFTLRVVRR